MAFHTLFQATNLPNHANVKKYLLRIEILQTVMVKILKPMVLQNQKI